MRDGEWRVVWETLKADWGGRISQTVDAEATWRRHFDGCDPSMLVDAMKHFAESSTLVSVAGLMDAYDRIMRSRAPAESVQRVMPPRRGMPVLPETYRTRYEAMESGVREAVEATARETVPYLLVNRAVPPWDLIFMAWVVTSARMDDRLLIDSGESYQAMHAREAASIDRSLNVAVSYLEHRRGCSQCTAYDQPDARVDHRGEPCPVGKVYHRPFYDANNSRWSTPPESITRRDGRRL